MINLRATNNQLTIGAKYTFLANNYSSGAATIDVDSIVGFTDDDYLLIGSFGSETAEIVQINGVPAGSTITLENATIFAHPESTRVTIIKYNQIKYYHTATATFASDTVLATIDIQADSLYTSHSDSTQSSGFGWFKFFNETVTTYSQASNAIPYSGFKKNSVKKVLDSFYSLLNAKERKIITSTDSLRWLSEAYSVTTSELNLINNEFKTSSTTDISVVANTKEYSLDTDFSSVISLWDSTNELTIDPIKLEKVASNDADSSNTIKYYIRGAYIGFSPTPSSAFTAKIRFKENDNEVTSLYDNIVLPDNNYMILVDYMLYRAYHKLQNPRSAECYKIFLSNIDRMKMTSFKRTNSKDAFEIARLANI